MSSYFPNYLQAERSAPRSIWIASRLVILAICAGLIYGLQAFGDLTLLLLWHVVVPVLPLIFWLLPGFWRNVCPLATVNQIPRELGFGSLLDMPVIVARYAPIISIIALFCLIPARHLFFNHDAGAVTALIGCSFALAFLGGVLFRGKSGWCGSFCPLASVQRLYGHTPAVVVSNSHCPTCLGCTKNCYDFNPHLAYLSDLHDPDRHIGIERMFFAGAFPGLIFAYFSFPDPQNADWFYLYFGSAAFITIGVGLFFTLKTVLKISAAKLTSLSAVLCLNAYYFYVTPETLEAIEQMSDLTLPTWSLYSFMTVIALLSIDWLRRVYGKEQAFLRKDYRTTIDGDQRRQQKAERDVRPAISVEDTKKELPFEEDDILLKVLEKHDQPINSGCRMGACGADPVVVLEGAENLSPPGPEELETLERLGYGEGVRLACCAKVSGKIKVALAPPTSAMMIKAPDFAIDEAVRKVVIVGNGVAGVTAADILGRYHPDCDLQLIGEERYPLYNRMAISKVIYGRQAMNGLMLLPDNWYEERKIGLWLNSHVDKINKNLKQVYLGTGEVLAYDKLILAMGAGSFVPEIQGFDRQGCFALRTADDSIDIRSYVQRNQARHAVVAGGGLLGLEAAYALHRLDLHVTVVERSDRLLRRQLDATASNYLDAYLRDLGIGIEYGAEADHVDGGDAIEGLHLKSASTPSWSGYVKTDLLLVAAGIVPNIALAKRAGVKTGQGVLVGGGMRTSDPDIYAAGDVAELVEAGDKVKGLWPVAVEQAKIAAINALGGSETYSGLSNMTSLKVADIDLTSIGAFAAGDGDDEIAFEEVETYRKIVLRDDVIIGGILFGHPEFQGPIDQAIRRKRRFSENLDDLRRGDWRCLEPS